MNSFRGKMPSPKLPSVEGQRTTFALDRAISLISLWLICVAWTRWKCSESSMLLQSHSTGLLPRNSLQSSISFSCSAIWIWNGVCPFLNCANLIILFSSAAAVINELKLPIALTIGTSTYASSKSGLETFGFIINKELNKFNIKVATIRILHAPTKLSDKLSKKEVRILKSKFKTDKFGSTEKIFKKINKLYNLRKIPKNNLFYDQLKKWLKKLYFYSH